MSGITGETFEIEVPSAPTTNVEDVVETHHGVEVHDPYRWLESDSPERTRWLREQDRRARAVFAAIPGRDQLRDAIREADRGVTDVVVYGVAGASPRLFFLKRAPDEDQGSVWMRDGWDGEERLLVDPRTRDRDGVHYSVDYAQPSWDGRFLAYGISASGSEESMIEIIEVDSGKILEERIDRAQYGRISWRPDNRSFFYWRRAKPAPDAQPKDWFKDSATFLHRLGDDPDKAEPVFGAAVKELGLSATRFSGVEVAPASDWALAGASPGTSADREFFVAPLAAVVPGANIPWRRVTGPGDRVWWMAAYQDRLFALSYDGAPRFQVLELDARSASLADARVFIPEGETVIQTFVAAQDAMYVQRLDRGLSRLERVSWDGTQREFLSLPFEGSVFDLKGSTDRPGVRFGMTSWTRPPAHFAYDAEQGVKDLGLVEPWPVDYSHLVTELVEVESADGTLVPLTIIRRADATLDGSAAADIEGYAAYGMVLAPVFRPMHLTWVDRGGVVAFCHARGGGERGKEWHLAGTKQNKEKGVEDFIACAEYLVQQGYTSPSRLTATGTSAGGLLVGGAITSRPELFAAALLRVPTSNLLRFLQVGEGGLANAPEFGRVDDAGEFTAILASDPYHRVVDGVPYPAVVLTGGLHDVRVPLWGPAKLAARLQAASTGGPVLLRVEWGAGHGLGSKRSHLYEEAADLFAFALWRSGVAVG